MSSYTSTTRVVVSPFSRQPDGEETVIGLPAAAVFLALPHDAVGLLDELARGKTVGEVQEEYRERTGETPDMEDLLSFLEAKGFVRPAGAPEAPIPAPAQAPQGPAPRYHFTNIPESLARRLVSKPVVAGCLVLAALGLAAMVAEPALLPNWRDLLFRRHLAAATIAIILLYYLSIFNHEMAHLVAARAAGVSSRLGIGHRLWLLVAESDMSGLWAVPPRQRYLPMLAGPLVDAASASVMVLVLFAGRRHWLPVSDGAVSVLRALVLVYSLNLLWQCFFFVRTDFYYAIANYFSCKNLLKDTEAFLKNGVARLVPRLGRVDQTGIPRREMRVVRGYAVFWILGRIAALAVLFLVQLPLLYSYGRLIVATLGAGYSASPQAFVDTLLMSLFITVPLLVGLVLWIRSLVVGVARSA